MKKILAISVILVALTAFGLMITTKIGPLMFWAIIIVCATYAFWGQKKLH